MECKGNEAIDCLRLQATRELVSLTLCVANPSLVPTSLATKTPSPPIGHSACNYADYLRLRPRRVSFCDNGMLGHGSLHALKPCTAALHSQ